MKVLRKILVLGGTGKTGRRVAERLARRSIPHRIGSRRGVIPFDWEDQSTWAGALTGVNAVYIAFYPEVMAPGAAATIRAFAGQAVESGVEHLVLLSGRGEEGAMACEEAVRNAGVEWTVLRCGWFNQNFSENFFVDGLRGGTLALPVGDVTEPFIDAEDIAEVAVAALTEPGHDDEIYELTGPRLLSFSQAVAEIAAASGRDIRFRNIPAEDFAAGMAAEGLPQDFIDLVMELFTQVLDGRNAYLADGVERALGRPPRDFADYAREAAATGVWGPREDEKVVSLI